MKGNVIDSYVAKLLETCQDIDKLDPNDPATGDTMIEILDALLKASGNRGLRADAIHRILTSAATRAKWIDDLARQYHQAKEQQEHHARVMSALLRRRAIREAQAWRRYGGDD